VYSLDDLRNHEHSFKNGSDLPWPQTNSLVMVSYPQGCDYFLDGVSMIRDGSDVFQQIFGALCVHPSVLFCSVQVCLAKWLVQHPAQWHLHNIIGTMMLDCYGLLWAVLHWQECGRPCHA
jgi:hypothetical protein